MVYLAARVRAARLVFVHDETGSIITALEVDTPIMLMAQIRTLVDAEAMWPGMPLARPYMRGSS